MTKNKKFAMAAAALGALVAGTPGARAQDPGQYTGTDSDGFGVTLQVYQAKDGRTLLSVVRATGFFYCDGKLLLTLGQPVPYGAAILMEAPFKNGTVEFAGRSNDLGALTGKVVAVDGGLSGRLRGYAALFSGTASPPGRSETKSCKTRDLRFTAQLSVPRK